MALSLEVRLPILDHRIVEYTAVLPEFLKCRRGAGKYYTPDVCAQYNKYGLWSFKEIHFSKYGTLVNTILYLVIHSEEGYFASELRDLLKVRVYNALSELYSRKRLIREQMGGEYLYLPLVLQDRQLERHCDTLHKTQAG